MAALAYQIISAFFNGDAFSPRGAGFWYATLTPPALKPRDSDPARAQAPRL